MDQIELKVARREVLGKKVRFLRRQGITPVHLFGRGIESESLQCETDKLLRVLAEAGRTKLISLKLGDESGLRNVVLREVQTEPLTGELLHVDLYEVRMAEIVKVEVPVLLVGEAPALKSKENTLVHELNALNVECLPADIPSDIELDISALTESGQALRVKDIPLDEKITVLNEPELVVVRISTKHVEREEGIGEKAVEAALPEKEERKE